MAHPTEKGQKYIGVKDEILTVKGFHGQSGIVYDTYKEAKRKNKPFTFIIVVNEEHGGGTRAKKCKLI